jgi:hypothetical protein
MSDGLPGRRRVARREPPRASPVSRSGGGFVRHSATSSRCPVLRTGATELPDRRTLGLPSVAHSGVDGHGSACRVQPLVPSQSPGGHGCRGSNRVWLPVEGLLAANAAGEARGDSPRLESAKRASHVVWTPSTRTRQPSDCLARGSRSKASSTKLDVCSIGRLLCVAG